MNEALIKKDYLKKIQKIQKLNKAYYEESAPVINDQEYDSLKQQIIVLENKYKFIKVNIHHQFQWVLNHLKILKK